MPRILSKKKAKREDLAHAVYVGRPSPWGNQWSHLPVSGAKFKVATVTEAVEKFREWAYAPEQEEWRAMTRTLLKGRDLVCWGCKPCHAEVVMAIANEEHA